MAAVTHFLTLPVREQGRTVEAAFALMTVRLVFGLLTFPGALRLLRVTAGETSAGRVTAAEADEVSRAIARAARHVPFRAACLQQAFAALLMLRRRGLSATIHLGLARLSGAGDLAAHAWSRCGEVPGTAAEAAPGFVPAPAFAAFPALTTPTRRLHSNTHHPPNCPR